MHPHAARKALFALTHRSHRSDFFNTLDEVCRNDTRTREQLEEIQWGKLFRIIRHAYDTVPYYRETWKKRGIAPGDIRHFDDFHEKIPCITKSDIRKNFKKCISERRYPGCYEVHTSGTTGSPASFIKDPGTHAYGTACRYRGRRWWGVNILDNEFRLWGVTSARSGSFHSKVRDRIKRVKDRMTGIRYWPAFNMHDNTLNRCFIQIKKHDPKIILGFTSAIVTFSAYLRNHALSFQDSALKLITYTAEPFYKNQRALVEKHFHPDIAAEYGSIENGIIGFDCPHGSMHLMDDDIYLESLTTADEKQALYATNLNNYAFPLIRYCTDDRGKILDKKCECGLPLRVMELTQGRIYDRIVRPDGKVIDSLTLDDFVMIPLFEFHECRRMQVVQKRSDKLVILVEACVVIPEPIRRAIEKNVAFLTQNTMELEIRRVDKINTEKSGKFKFIVSEIEQPSDILP